MLLARRAAPVQDCTNSRDAHHVSREHRLKELRELGQRHRYEIESDSSSLIDEPITSAKSIERVDVDLVCDEKAIDRL